MAFDSILQLDEPDIAATRPEIVDADLYRHHFSQAELAKRWRLSPRTLERWRWTRDGPCYLKIGARVIYRIEDIEAFEAARLRSTDVVR